MNIVKLLIFQTIFILSFPVLARSGGESRALGGGACSFHKDKIQAKTQKLREAIQMQKWESEAAIEKAAMVPVNHSESASAQQAFEEANQAQSLEANRGKDCFGPDGNGYDWLTSEKIINDCDFEGIKASCEAARAKAAEAGDFQKKLAEITARSKDGRPASGPLKDLKSLYQSADNYHKELKKAIAGCDKLAKGHFSAGNRCLNPYEHLESETYVQHAAQFCEDNQIDQLIGRVEASLSDIAQTACEVFNGQVDAKAGEIEIHNTKSAIATTMNRLCDGNAKSCRKVAGE
ncbi:MAG: hypothetical protein KDD33_03690 [Bdellovibrionales bacterium]|nr:hypothetical protein [Bdellovibrionales bacterium]